MNASSLAKCWMVKWTTIALQWQRMKKYKSWPMGADMTAVGDPAAEHYPMATLNASKCIYDINFFLLSLVQLIYKCCTFELHWWRWHHPNGRQQSGLLQNGRKKKPIGRNCRIVHKMRQPFTMVLFHYRNFAQFAILEFVMHIFCACLPHFELHEKRCLNVFFWRFSILAIYLSAYSSFGVPWFVCLLCGPFLSSRNQRIILVMMHLNFTHNFISGSGSIPWEIRGTLKGINSHYSMISHFCSSNNRIVIIHEKKFNRM